MGAVLVDSNITRGLLARAAALIAPTALAACSSLSPTVGAVQQCEAVDGPTDDSQYYSMGAADSGYSYAYMPVGPASDGGARSTTCGVPSGTWCDDCESTNCCATRLNCYGDPACAAADQALDVCLNGASIDGGTSECWSAFATQGQAVAQTRLACERQCCQAACRIP